MTIKEYSICYKNPLCSFNFGSMPNLGSPPIKESVLFKCQAAVLYIMDNSHLYQMDKHPQWKAKEDLECCSLSTSTASGDWSLLLFCHPHGLPWSWAQAVITSPFSQASGSFCTTGAVLTFTLSFSKFYLYTFVGPTHPKWESLTTLYNRGWLPQWPQAQTFPVVGVMLTIQKKMGRFVRHPCMGGFGGLCSTYRLLVIIIITFQIWGPPNCFSSSS